MKHDGGSIMLRVTLSLYVAFLTNAYLVTVLWWTASKNLLIMDFMVFSGMFKAWDLYIYFITEPRVILFQNFVLDLF